MNLNEIEAKCFIMALFIRDDGLRFLLGSGAYEFKDSQLMFAGNTIENDVVAVQGNDGYMLAGQVRRPNTQVFDGYIGDATVSKSEVEGYRRDFMAFFQKNHFYTVVYVMADGSAIQRRRGFLVDAPTSQELWQMYPEYHVALNFEDVNYYKYSENDEGEETYAKSADIGLAKVQYGGLIWDNDSDIEVSGSGTNIELDGTIAGGAIESVEMYGDTTQQTYTGKNLLNQPSSWSFSRITNFQPLGEGTYYVSCGNVTKGGANDPCIGSSNSYITITSNMLNKVLNFAGTALTVYSNGWSWGDSSVTSTVENLIITTSPIISIADYEPYVGGTASPNPDYPQEVQVVTGEQTITVSNGQGESQEYKVNLGKNLFDINQYTNAVTRGSTLVSLTKTSDTTLRTTNLYASTNNYCAIPIPDASRLLGNTITMSCNVTLTNVAATKAAIFWKTTSNSIGTQIGDTLSITTGGAKTLTFSVPDAFPSGTNGIFCAIYGSDSAQPTDSYVDWENIQIEKGSTATTYAPYFTPIELCKIGTYQDYIYKSGEDWYVHKETAKVTFTGAVTETWSSATAATGYVRFSTASGANHADNNGYCNEFINRGSQSHGAYEYVWVQPNANAFYIQVLNTRANDLAGFRTWLGAHPATVYYDIATPTDTQITNSALIAQLEALNAGDTYDGTTVITVSSEYLASPLEITVMSIGGGGVVWDENGAEWEAGGGGEIVIVNVDSIENILPVWTIRGEAENPTLTNLTTGMSITYNGTVASGQTLVIDLLNKTAKLNGTSVISDVSGQWVEFKPGNNRVSYSTENANAPDSTIEWQEVVG